MEISFQCSPALPFCSTRFLVAASFCTQTSETGELGNSVWQHPPQLQEKLMAVQKCANLRLWNDIVISGLAWKEHSSPLSVSQSLHDTTLHATMKSSSLSNTYRIFGSVFISKIPQMWLPRKQCLTLLTGIFFFFKTRGLKNWSRGKTNSISVRVEYCWFVFY